MKYILITLISMVPFLANASFVTIQCKSAEIDGIHKFDAKGMFTVDEYNKVEGFISLQTQKAQAEGSIQIFEEVPVQGTWQHFEAGDISVNSVDQVILFTKDSYIKSLNLLVDFKEEVASQVFSVDNFIYKSNCFQVQFSK